MLHTTLTYNFALKSNNLTWEQSRSWGIVRIMIIPESISKDRLFWAESLAGGGGFLAAGEGRAATFGGEVTVGLSSAGAFLEGDLTCSTAGSGSYEKL